MLFWTIYNLVVLAFAMAVCVEVPRAKTVPEIEPERARLHLAPGSEVSAWLVRLTQDEAWVRGGPDLVEGSQLTLDIDGIGTMPATVLRLRPRGAALAIRPDASQRNRIVVKLHTRAGRHGTTRLDVGGIISGFLRRMIRKTG